MWFYSLKVFLVIIFSIVSKGILCGSWQSRMLLLFHAALMTSGPTYCNYNRRNSNYVYKVDHLPITYMTCTACGVLVIFEWCIYAIKNPKEMTNVL